MEIVRISIAGASGYGPIDEAYNDKLTISDSYISYEYKPHPMAQSDTNIYRKWLYKTTSPLFKEIFKKVAEMPPDIINNDDKLFVTDIGSTEITVTFEDKHREKANFFCPSEFFLEYFRVIKQLVPACEYTPAVLITSDDYDVNDEE